MKKHFLLFTLCLVFYNGFTQQKAQYTQYIYNTVNINPAYAGTRGALNILGLHRNQWVGMDGAPVSNTLSMNTPLIQSNLGLGVSLVSDKIGPISENAISVDLSYNIETSETWKLAFGIKTTAYLMDFDPAKLDPKDTGDALIPRFNSFKPNIGVGLYWHSDKGYIGFSVPDLIENVTYDDINLALYKQKINYYLIAGLVFDLNEYVKFKPALLTKVVNGSPLQLDVSGNFLINDKFHIGLSYRWSAAISAMVGFQITDELFMGYGYDYETTVLKSYNSGSHEIFLRYEIFRGFYKHRNSCFC